MLLISERIQIRPTTVQDLEFVCFLESNKENVPYIIPWSLEKHEHSIKNIDMIHLIIEDVDTKEYKGFIILACILNKNKNIELMRITLGSKSKGIGTEAFKLIMDWVFKSIKAHRLWLDVKTTNTRAIRLYQKMGFTLEGTLRECLKNENGYESLHILSMLDREYATRIST